MYVRPRHLIEEELTHVEFLLDEMWKWDSTVVPGPVRRYLTTRYERHARLLRGALTEAPSDPNAPEPLPEVEIEDEALAEAREALAQEMQVATPQPPAPQALAAPPSEALPEVEVAMEEPAPALSREQLREMEALIGAEAPAAQAAPAPHMTQAFGVPSELIAQAEALQAPPRDEVEVEVAVEEPVLEPAPHATQAFGITREQLAALTSQTAPHATQAFGLTREQLAALVPAPPQPVAEARSEPPPALAAASAPAPSEQVVDTSHWASEIVGSEAPIPALQKAEQSPPPPAADPLFSDAPARRGPASVRQARPSAVRPARPASAWERVWKPFLYESVGWFLGAFLIVSGSLYFAFSSWGGMTSFTRSLVVFGLTAGYSSAFSLVGNLLSRRRTLAIAGYILGLIGSAVAPLAGLALGPVDTLALEGVPLWLLAPLLLTWALAAARLARRPAAAFNSASTRLLQVGVLGTTLMMGLASLVAPLGPLALWLNVLPCALLLAVASRGGPRSQSTLAFDLGAPLYLLALFSVRLHLALGTVHAAPPLGSYAPLLAFVLAACLRFRTLAPEQAADPLALGAVSLQAGCLVLATTSPPPAFFLTSLVVAWSTWSLSRGSTARLPWLYATYVAALLTFGSAGQLNPAASRAMQADVATWLGYESGSIPLAFAALLAVPYILGGAVLAALLLARAESMEGEEGESAEATAEVLLRATAAASGLAVVVGYLGADARPALLSALALVVVCVGTGLWVRRDWLVQVGALLVLGVPLSAWQLHGAHAAATCGVLALVLAALATRAERLGRMALGVAVAWVGVAALAFGLRSSELATALAGMALAGAAGLWVAWQLESPELVAVAALGAALVVPRLVAFALPPLVALSLAATALGLSALGELRGRLGRLGLAGMACTALALGWALQYRAPWLGLVVLCSAGALAVASRSYPQARPVAVAVAVLALLPPAAGFAPWRWMTPALSVALLAVWALGASLATARLGRGPSTLTAGVVGLVCLAVPLGVASGPQPYPLLLGAALAALLSARSLEPTLALGLSALLAGAWVLPLGPMHTLVAAVVFTGLALLELVPAAPRVLTGGGRRFAVAASVCALVLTGAACLLVPGSAAPLVVGAGLLPLVWMRATGQAPFAAASVLLPLLLAVQRVVGPAHELSAWWPALPLGALVLGRAVLHVPAMRQVLLGTEEERPVRVLADWLQWALVLSGLGLEAPLLGLSSPQVPAVGGLFATALVLLPGERPSLRVALAVGLLVPCTALHPAALVLLLALALLVHHRPAWVWAACSSAVDERLLPTATWGALALAGASVGLGPTPGHLAALAGVLLVAAFLLSRRGLLTAAVVVLALAAVGEGPGQRAFSTWGVESARWFAAVGLAAALLSAACQVGSVQRALSGWAERLTPGLGSTWSEPLWEGAAAVVAAPLLAHAVAAGPGGLTPSVAVPCGLAAAALLCTRERRMAYAAAGLVAAVLVAWVPVQWAPAAVSAAGLVLCAVGAWVEEQGVEVGGALHRSGWVLSLVSVAWVPGLRHPGMPVCLALGAGSAWAVVYRRPGREAVGWAATALALHALLVFVAVANSTGREPALLWLYLGASMAVLALGALLLVGPPVRRQVGLWLVALALGEVLLGVAGVAPGVGGGREALVVCTALALLLAGLGYRAVRKEDEAAAFAAQVVVALGYVVLRRYGMGTGLGLVDSLVALVGGVLCSGLYVWVQREEELPALRRPALWGAFALPLVGLFAAPWEAPGYVAALLVGHAAHFAALAVHPSRRAQASLAAALAFNAALAVAWWGTHVGEPQHYIIPAGLSLLVLLRVFGESLQAEARAWLRALTVTVVYAAGAWNPLLFSDGRDMVLCVVVCLLGVAAGAVLRIRSYVYLGSAFLVTCVLANLTRYGMRDQRVGAAFLSLLGLAVVGFMVLLTARRAELMQRYERVRSRLSSWEG